MDEILDWHDLAESLRNSERGLTMREMEDLSGKSRKTVHRWLNQVEGRYTNYRLDRGAGLGREYVYRLVPDQLDRRSALERDDLMRFDPALLFDLDMAIGILRNQHLEAKAHRLERLRQTLESMLRGREVRRYQSGQSAVRSAVAFMPVPAPSRPLQYDLSQLINDAILAQVAVRFEYRNGPIDAHPLAYIYGSRLHYLVCAGAPSGQIFKLRLDRILDASVLGEQPGRPAQFDASRYAQAAFGGLFHGEKREVVLRFSQERSADAAEFVFHPTQEACRDREGRLIIKFEASGDLAICHHLFTWGPDAEILEPASLRETYRELLRSVLVRHGEDAA